MVFGIPALNLHKMTSRCLQHNAINGVSLIVMDNASEPQYEHSWGYKENVGYFYPLKTLYQNYKDPVIGLMHNDLFIYDKEWPIKVLQCFEENPKLGILGFAGYEDFDSEFEGVGLHANFVAGSFKKNAFKKIEKYEDGLAYVDSLFMAFRSSLIPEFNINGDILPYYWYEKIWALIAMEKGYTVGALGVPIKHLGGQTFLKEDSHVRWALDFCRGNKIYTDVPDRTLYKEGLHRFLSYIDEKASSL
jgi:hypothetical protein